MPEKLHQHLVLSEYRRALRQRVLLLPRLDLLCVEMSCQASWEDDETELQHASMEQFMEQIMVVESLRMLQGSENTVIFSFENDEFSVRLSACKHVDKVSLEILKDFAKYGTSLAKVSDICDGRQQYPKTAAHGRPSVISSLLRYLDEFLEDTRCFLEKLIRSNENAVRKAQPGCSLHELSRNLIQVFHDLGVITDLLDSVLIRYSFTEENPKFLDFVALEFLKQKITYFSRIDIRLLSPILVKILFLVYEDHDKVRLITNREVRDGNDWEFWLRSTHRTLTQESKVAHQLCSGAETTPKTDLDRHSLLSRHWAYLGER